MTEQATGAHHPQPRPRSGGQQSAAVEHVTGAQSLIRSLEEVGCDTVFGIPGGAILPAYDPMMDSKKVRHILVRHEQGAGHAATGYAQATGKVGVCMATSGPGATNLVTPIADAHMDSVPLVAITGQVSSKAIGTDASRRRTSSASPCRSPSTTSWSPGRGHPEDDRRGVPHRGHRPSGPGPRRHRQGRPAGEDHLRVAALPGSPRLPAGHQAARQADPRGRQAHLPGQAPGPVRRRRRHEVRRDRRAEGPGRADRRPGLYHPDGAGLLPRQSPPARRHAGHARLRHRRHGAAEVGPADRPGTRFDDRVTGKLDSFAPYAKIIHADIDPAEIGKNRAVDVPIVGDAREVIADLIQAVQAEHTEATPVTTAPGGATSAAGARPTRWATTCPRTAASRPSRSSSGSARSRRRAPSSRRASASTRCGPRTSSSTRSRAPG